jgi:hypothetical protein
MCPLFLVSDMLVSPSKEQQRLMITAFAGAADIEEEFLQEKQQVGLLGLF